MPSAAAVFRSRAALRIPPVTSSLSLGRRLSRSSSKRVRSRITQITSNPSRRSARDEVSVG
ncbi:hypothetical protein D3C87_2040170 [compost metagenome]